MYFYNQACDFSKNLHESRVLIWHVIYLEIGSSFNFQPHLFQCVIYKKFMSGNLSPLLRGEVEQYGHNNTSFWRKVFPSDNLLEAIPGWCNIPLKVALSTFNGMLHAYLAQRHAPIAVHSLHKHTKVCVCIHALAFACLPLPAIMEKSGWNGERLHFFRGEEATLYNILFLIPLYIFGSIIFN